MLPWQLTSTEVNIIETYEAGVIQESEHAFTIEFTDFDGLDVEAQLKKEDFQEFPYPVKEGSYFSIVLYKRLDQPGVTVSAWPVARYWNTTLVTGHVPDVGKKVGMSIQRLQFLIKRADIDASGAAMETLKEITRLRDEIEQEKERDEDKELIEVATFMETKPGKPPYLAGYSASSPDLWWQWDVKKKDWIPNPNKDPRKSMDLEMEVLDKLETEKDYFSRVESKWRKPGYHCALLANSRRGHNIFEVGDTRQEAIFNAVVKLIEHLKEKENV